MHEYLPYEQKLTEQLNDLPLPDENAAWEDMKRRLEDDDDRGIIPIWLRGCGLWVLLGILLLAIGWWLIRPEKWWNNKEDKVNEAGNTAATHLKQENNKQKTADSTSAATGYSQEKNNETIKSNREEENQNNIAVAPTGQANDKTRQEAADADFRVSSPAKKTTKKNTAPGRNNRHFEKNKERSNTGIAGNKPETGKRNRAVPVSPSIPGDDKRPDSARGNDPSVTITNDFPAKNSDSLETRDSIAKTISDTAARKKEDPVAKTSVAKKDSTQNKKFSFGAGIALFQQLPLNGQKAVPYNSLGRKGSLGDYIPAVYARMYREDKWFLQAGFRYGAPQYNKEIIYQQEASIDTFNQNTYSTHQSLSLKKTFYHQLPVSFNYFVKPGWSVGGGFVWNKFNSAISEQNIDRRNTNIPTDTFVLKKIIVVKNDTSAAFSKSYFQATIESQYRWRRFSIGARYAFGLQPFIRFTLPNGTEQKEKNSSLQVFLRYELWRSKKN